jgi:hypothetical protein
LRDEVAKLLELKDELTHLTLANAEISRELP